MTDPPTYPPQPVELPLSLGADPEPTPGCDVCRALDGERAEARAKGDLSKATDVNVEIRNHAHHPVRRTA
ncbi:hypothetical protein [Streptomyces sp. NPDC046985]|uniref:hypothetical protein n=1 Tax=Streptomyces sp. NPDC046985 TaxID=3155377 RepID=UPI0033DB744B